MKITIKPGLYGYATKREDPFVKADVTLPEYYIKKGLFWLPSAFHQNGRPRYVMPIPTQYLSDVGLLLLAAYEQGFQGYEYPSRCFLDQHLAPKDLFVDVGCHWGTFSLHAATVNRGKNKVIAIDPLPANINAARQWLNVNNLQSYVQLIEAAISSEKSIVKFSVSHSMGGKINTGGMNKQGRQIEVNTIPLDELIDTREDDLSVILKIDVEGGEYSVLKGSKTLLESGNVKAVIWEYSQPKITHDSNSQAYKAIDLLTNHGYKHFVFAHHHMAGPLIPFAPVAGVYNVISVPKRFDLNPCYGDYSETFAPLTPPFYSDLSREDIFRHTEQTLTNKTSDSARWRDIFMTRVGAEERATIATEYLIDATSVLDIGAGAQCLKELLPPDIKYYPLDLVPQSSDCIIGDLNQGYYPELKTDWVVFLNILEFLHHIEWILKSARGCAQNIILSYDVGENRKSRGYFNTHTEQEMIDILHKAGWQISQTRRKEETIYFICITAPS